MSIDEMFIKDITARFESCKKLGDKTFDQLGEKDFFFCPSTESNSIAVIVQHMSGNMLSRFTNFLTEDGEKPWRNRDSEFEQTITTKAEILDTWNRGWDCLFNTLSNIEPAQLLNVVTIRSESLTAYDALLRQLAHYAYHVGQIVFIGRMARNSSWVSLSIPKGQSQQYNEGMKYNVQ
jgi:hypothetical protein